MQSHWDQSYTDSACALLITERAAPDAVQALGLAQVRIRATIAFDEASKHLKNAPADLILVEAHGVEADQLSSLLERIDAATADNRTGLIASIGTDQIDVAAGALLGPRRQFLCEPTLAERLGAIAFARAEAQQALVLHDNTNEGDVIRLQKLNEEVARIADTLFQLTRTGDAHRTSGSVRDAGFAFRPGPGSMPATESSAMPSASVIRAVIRARGLRAKYFPKGLFADPAWDMLLDLFAAEIEGKRVSVSSLCIAAAVPPTTALRWINTMHEAGLFDRKPDPSDRRRAYIGLSERGLHGMESYLQATNLAGLPLI